MSGLFLAPKTANLDLGKVAKALSFSRYASAHQIECQQFKGVVVRVDQMDLWGPASDRSLGVQVVLCGRVALEPHEWRAADSLGLNGGKAAKVILNKWLELGPRIADWLNGAFTVLISDPREHALHVFTDRMGMGALYRAGRKGVWISSHPDVLADALAGNEGPQEIDWSTVAEFVATGTSAQPYTYYKNVVQLDAGCHYRISADGSSNELIRSEYWRPKFLEELPNERENLHELSEELASAIKGAVRRRTNALLGATGVLLSGGIDSRAMLFSAAEPSAVECITLFDAPNDELETASRLSEAAGAKHHKWRREFEYYGKGTPETVRISGGIWSALDGHYTSARGKLDSLHLGVLLTGCYADYMFKGLAFNRFHRMLLRRCLPLYALSDFDYQFYQPHYELVAPWQRLVNDRLEQRYFGLPRDDYPRWALAYEDRRLRPLSREPDASGRHVLWRTQPFDWAFGDNAVLDVYGRIPVCGKLNGRVFELAVARICSGPAGLIPNNNYRTIIGASETSKAIQFVAASVGRKVQRMIGRLPSKPTIATSGSWPDWSYYISHSQVLEDLWRSAPFHIRKLLGEMVGEDLWSLDMRQLARSPLRFMRLLTVSEWLSMRCQTVRCP